MEPFGSEITRKIWGNIENIILIYVGSAAEFALNPDLHWLFFTKRLPDNPQMRFIETFTYNQRLFFSPKDKIPEIAQRIRNVHTSVEQSRTKKEGSSQKITNKAFTQVADMLIDYGIKGYEYLHHSVLPLPDKETYYQDLKQIFQYMGIIGMENHYQEWLTRREQQIDKDLFVNELTDDLYEAYRKDIGNIRLWFLKKFQAKFVHPVVVRKLMLHPNFFFSFLYKIYPYVRNDVLFHITIGIFARKKL